MKKIFITFIIMYASIAHTSQLQVLAVPGMNGVGAKPDYIRKILGQDMPVHEATTPGLRAPGDITPDLGGFLCMRHIRKAYNNINGPMIGFGASQGSAGITKLAANPNTRLKAVIVEAVLASPSSTILHNIDRMGLRSLTQWRLAPYVLPYLAKLSLPFYWPFSEEPIQALKNIPKYIPIIIIHAEQDPETPYQDARAFYKEACLHRIKEQNVYFISVPEYAHVNLLEDYCNNHREHRQVVQRILKKHEILPDAPVEVGDLREYQPISHDPVNIVEHHHNLMTKARNHNRIGYVLQAMACAASVYLAHCIEAKMPFSL